MSLIILDMVVSEKNKTKLISSAALPLLLLYCFISLRFLCLLDMSKHLLKVSALGLSIYTNYYPDDVLTIII